jgi:hypothetical protein
LSRVTLVGVAVSAVLAVAVGCGGSAPSVRPTPHVLLTAVGAGYRLMPPTGPLSRSDLASATALPRAQMTSYLDRVSLTSAAERVWTAADGGFVTDIVVTVATAAQAADLVDVASRVLPGPATRPFDVAGAPRARGFVQTSDVRGQIEFCVIAFVAVDARAFVLTRCTPYPQDTTVVQRLVDEQIARASA